MPIMTNEVIEESKSSAGGWTKAQLAVVGLEWPPKNGWKLLLIGKDYPQATLDRFKELRTCRVKNRKPRIEESVAYVNFTPDFTIYTDGGCWPNPGPGGWGFVCVETGFEDCGGSGDSETTNNRQEITAVLAALKHHRKINGVDKSLRIVSDSQYVVNSCSLWMKKWKRNGWTLKKATLKNVDLWKQIDEAMSGLNVRFQWVKGHNGNTYNELADRLAEKGAKGGTAEEVNSDIDREFADMFR